MSNTFKLNYKNGSHEIVQTDAASVEEQINRTFGLSPEEAAEFGVSVEMLPSVDEPENLVNTLVEETLKNPDDTVLVPTADGAQGDLLADAGGETTGETTDTTDTIGETVHIHVHVGETSEGTDNT